MNSIFITVVSLSLSATLIALLLWLLKPWLTKYVTYSWRYYIWLLVILRLLIPLAPDMNLINVLARYAAPKFQSVETRESVQDIQVPFYNPETESGEIIRDVPADAAGENPTIYALIDYVGLAWFVVALMVFVRKITSYGSFLRFIKAGCSDVDEEEQLSQLKDCCRRFDIKPLGLKLNKLAAAPMLVGFVQPVIILPRHGYSPEERSFIFMHELVHYRRRDIVFKWLVQASVSLHWFNPLVYCWQKQIDRLCELSCDEAVLRCIDTDQHLPYGDVLLRAFAGSGSYGDVTVPMAMSEGAENMKARLAAIMSYQPQKRSVFVASICLAGFLLVASVFAGAYTDALRKPNDVLALAIQDEQRLDSSADIKNSGLNIKIGSDGIDLNMSEDRDASSAGKPNGMNMRLDGSGLSVQISGDGNGKDSDALSSAWGLREMISSLTEQLGKQSYSNRSVGNASFKRLIYQDGYFFSISWRMRDKVSNYPYSRLITVGDDEYAVAFTRSIQWEGIEPELFEAMEKAVSNLVTSSSEREWYHSCFVVESFSEYYSEEPADLAWTFYHQDNISHFMVLLPLLNEGEIIALLEQSCHDVRNDAILFLVDYLPDDYVADELVREAAERNEPSVVMWLQDYISDELRAELRKNEAVWPLIGSGSTR